MGIGATLNPDVLFNSKTDLRVDIGLTLHGILYATDETTYVAGNLDGVYDHDDDEFGARVDYALQLGLRYKFIGLYVIIYRELFDLYNPEYVHVIENGSGFDLFYEDIEFGSAGVGITLNM